MDKILVFSLLAVCICKHGTYSINLTGPLIYVVTPSPRPAGANDEGRSAPFYYNNWMRRMDPPRNATTTTTPIPDLIFAEFESGNKMKSIRKLLEKEKIQPKTTTTTPRPIYVPDASEEVFKNEKILNNDEKQGEMKPDMTDYFALYNNLYNHNSEALAPVYVASSSTSTTMSTTTTSTPSPAANVENIWPIIDSQKYDQYPGQWEEESLSSDDKATSSDAPSQPDDENKTDDQGQQEIDDDFSLPGFATSPGNGAENESRAIRTEPNMRFPYISLKPFQMKTQNKPIVNSISNSKKGNSMFTSLDNFYDIKNPVRGEAEDVVPMRQPIDRYNPAQPYLPDYGTKSKQSSPSAPPNKAVANLVPPPPPPPPKNSDGNFPSPSSYESFPPYAPSGSPTAPSPPPVPVPKPSVSYQPPVDTSDYSGTDSAPGDIDDGPSMDLGYRYKPPSPPVQPFLPTPPSSPSGGYSYDKPPMSKPFTGYSYDKPPMSKPFTGYSYDKPPMADDSPPDSSDDKPNFQGYHYSKPEAPAPDHHDHPPISYGHDAPSYGPDYPELIFDKPNDGKGGDDMKDMGMAPPPLPADMKPDMDHGPPSDDHGFPHDFPGDLKFHHDFDDHDFHHHHHHHTTTTTTEMPRVNRYSYYYLGKKLYYLPLYFSVYFIVYVGALIIKAVLRHKIVYPNSWRPNDQTASFFAKRSVDSWDLSHESLNEITGKVTHAIAVAGEKYFAHRKKK